MLGVLLILTILSVAVYRVCRHYMVLVKSVKNVPCQKTVPLIGDLNIINNRNDIIAYLNGVAGTLSITRTWLGPKLIVMLNDPKLIRQVLTAPQLLSKPKFFYDVIDFPNGLICSPYKLWRIHRKIINPIFSPKILQSFISIFEENAKTLNVSLTPYVDTNAEFDLLDEVMHCTLETVFATTMGVNGLSVTNTKMAIAHLRKIVDFIGKRVFNPKLFFNITYRLTRQFKEDVLARRSVYEIVNSFIEVRKSALANKQNVDLDSDQSFKPQNFIDQLISKTKAQKSDVYLENEEIKDECYTILAAGSETTAITVSYAILLLAMHPAIQAKVTEEVDDLLANNDVISAQNLNALFYMEMVVKETLRLLPAVPLIAREPMADLDLGVCTLKPSTIVCINIFNLHRNENLWGQDADEFQPDRFNATNVGKIIPYSYIPFSSGPRNCVGHRYAIMSIKIMLIHLLKSYKFSTKLKLQDLKFAFTVSLKLHNKNLVTVEKR